MKSKFLLAAGSAALLASVAVAQGYGTTDTSQQAQPATQQAEPATDPAADSYEAAGERG